jgi:hypothetical protein
LHSILIALNDPEYQRAKDKETYVRKVREEVANVTLPEILQQELFDKNHEEIRALLSDPEEYLDPSIYYRALEHFFSVNLYTYGYHPETKTPELLIPNHLLFHVQAYRERPTILILKNSGISTDLLPYPQSELIMEYQKGKRPIALFQPEMGKIHYDVMNEINKIYTWRITADQKIQRLELNKMQLDYSTIFNDTIQSQIIDEYGKLRGILFRDGSVEMALFVHPSQPLNRISENMCSDHSTVRIPKAPLRSALNMFGTPKQITKHYDGTISGFWFGEPALFYVPIQALNPAQEKKYLQLPEGTATPFEIRQDQEVERLKALQSNLSRIQQLMWWCWKIAERDGQHLEDFWDTYVSYYRGKVQDSAYFYYLGGIPKILAPVSSVEEAVVWMGDQEEQGIADDLIDSRIIEGRWIRGGKMQCYNRSFYNNMREWLFRRWKVSQSSETLQNTGIPTVLKDYYTMPQDFQMQNEEVIFIGKESFKEWLRSATHYKSQYTIHKKIGTRATLSPEPFLFREGKTKKIYLIQNVKRGDLSRALEVGRQWRQEKINPGVQAKPLQGKVDYNVFINPKEDELLWIDTYRVSSEEEPSEGPSEPQNKAITLDTPLNILQYNTNTPIRYAALLEML